MTAEGGWDLFSGRRCDHASDFRCVRAGPYFVCWSSCLRSLWRKAKGSPKKKNYGLTQRLDFGSVDGMKANLVQHDGPQNRARIFGGRFGGRADSICSLTQNLYLT
ncbi:hypothetical protein CRG98_000651 [Punica granatum]|uniref:Uncharacterized protein n=1 Tax=Punica granatum TaxID=22663 RepID=A0A2I0LE56_PUNGR|nr:hypothetical protein CRG98_000651 [Punica granatum]